MQGGNTWLFADSYAAHLQDTSSLWNVKFVFYHPNSKSVMSSTRPGFG
jgi:hypothetical protein